MARKKKSKLTKFRQATGKRIKKVRKATGKRISRLRRSVPKTAKKYKKAVSRKVGRATRSASKALGNTPAAKSLKKSIKANGGAAATVMRWADAIASLGASEDLLKLSKVLAQAAKSNIAFGFRSETDPYGDKWKDRADGSTDRQILTQTSELRRSWNSTVRPSGFRIKSAKSYAKHHQYGTRRMVARKMVPDNGNLPPEWSREFNHMARLWQKRVLRNVKRKFR